MTLAIAFSGGGNWCIGQMGFLHALHERGYETQAASGVSFGSFSAIAALTGDVLGTMARIRRFREIVDVNLLKPWQTPASPRDVVHRFERGLRAVLPNRLEVPGDLFLMAVKVPQLQPVVFTKDHFLPDVLRAAMAMPPLPATRYGGLVLRDAGVRVKYGIRPLVEAGYKKVLALGAFQDFFGPRWQIMNRTFPTYRDVTVHEEVLTMWDKIGMAEFTRSGFAAMDEVFEAGYNRGRRFPGRVLDSLVNVTPAQSTPSYAFREIA